MMKQRDREVEGADDVRDLPSHRRRPLEGMVVVLLMPVSEILTRPARLVWDPPPQCQCSWTCASWMQPECNKPL